MPDIDKGEKILDADKVHKVMSEFKRGKLHSHSKKGPLVKSRKQAIAIALSEAGMSKDAKKEVGASNGGSLTTDSFNESDPEKDDDKDKTVSKKVEMKGSKKGEPDKKKKTQEEKEWELAGPLSDALILNTDCSETRRDKFGRVSSILSGKKKRTERDKLGRLKETRERDSVGPTENEDSGMIEVFDAAVPTFEVTEATVYDEVSLDYKADVRYTEDGYLVATPRVARTGIQIYKGSECKRPDLAVVRVYRPADSVFSNDALHSFAHRPVTIEHPPAPITADNWKKYSVGQTGDEVIRDGDTIRVPMVLMDKVAITAFKDGKRQLSMGYTCDLVWKPGVTPSGEKYDALQTAIKANHLAVVDNARGGSQLTIGDTKVSCARVEGPPVVLNTPNYRKAVHDSFERGLDKAITRLGVLGTQDWNENARTRSAESRKRKSHVRGWLKEQLDKHTSKKKVTEKDKKVKVGGSAVSGATQHK